jgi:hypothetical protein
VSRFIDRESFCEQIAGGGRPNGAAPEDDKFQGSKVPDWARRFGRAK